MNHRKNADYFLPRNWQYLMMNKCNSSWSVISFDVISRLLERKLAEKDMIGGKMWKKVEVWVAQSCLTLCYPIDWSPPGSSVHGILQARILEWLAVPFSRGSSRPRDWTPALGDHKVDVSKTMAVNIIQVRIFIVDGNTSNYKSMPSSDKWVEREES